MKNLIIVSIFWILSAFQFSKDRTDLLAQKWVMQEMQMGNSLFSEEMVERQRRNGIETILHFNKNNTCLVHIRSPKGKTTKRNKWQFMENQTKLMIQPEGDEPAQTFAIEKLSAKKMVLTIMDNGSKQIFVYKVLKD
jgi:hypothetical protein